MRLVLGILAGVALAGGVASSPAAAASPRAEVRGVTCRSAGRSISVTAVMRPVPGTVRMALRFSLERRAPGAGFRMAPAPQLGQWVSPGNPTLGRNPADVWMLRQNVVNLTGPAAYRFRVWFRWTGAHNHVLATAVRLSSLCHQAASRPDLVVRSLAIASAGGGQDRYKALIHNAGTAASGAFSASLSSGGGGSSPGSMAFSSLAPGASERQSFVGPACSPGSWVTVVADPSGQVADADRANNTLAVTCPAPAASSRRSYTS